MLKPKKYIQVTLSDGRPFELDSTHPTFDELVTAVKAKKWNEVPLLVNEAENIAYVTEGLVGVSKNGVTYNGNPVHSSLASRIMEMAKEGKDIKYLLCFMDNLFLNPSQHARDRFYEWMTNNDLPITDDGCCLAYKSVDDNLKDTYSHTVDNSPGQIIMMSRAVANSEYDTQCATGYHLCSKHYGLYGTKTLAVKFNPKHILSAVGGKIRVTKYEVLALLGNKENIDFSSNGYKSLEKKLVVEIKKERRELVGIVLSSKAIQRLIRQKKLKKTTIMRYPYAKLAALAQKHDLLPNVGPDDKFYLKKAREASKLGAIQLAKQIGIKATALAKIEKDENPSQEDVNRVLEGIQKMTGHRDISFPKPVALPA